MKAMLGKADFPHQPNLHERVLFDQQRAFLETAYITSPVDMTSGDQKQTALIHIN
jgi:hypothetical protein